MRWTSCRGGYGSSLTALRSLSSNASQEDYSCAQKARSAANRLKPPPSCGNLPIFKIAETRLRQTLIRYLVQRGATEQINFVEPCKPQQHILVLVERAEKATFFSSSSTTQTRIPA